MAFYIGTDKVIEDTDATAGISTSSNLDRLQINGTDVLTHDGSTVTLKNVDISDSIEGTINSDNVTEGSTNLFYTAARQTAIETYADTAEADAIATSSSYTDAAEISANTYTDTQIATVLPLSGGTLTGLLTLSGAPTNALHAATKSYVDSAVTTGTGALDTDDISEGSTNLYYTDARVDARLSGGSIASLTTTGDIVVGGDLTVSGTTTTIDTNQLNIGDNIITLNSDETGTPSQNAGLEVERGTSDNVAIRWNEGTDVWEFTNDGTSYTSLGTSSTFTGDTDGVSEGSTNLYYTDARVQTYIGGDRTHGAITADSLTGTASLSIKSGGDYVYIRGSGNGNMFAGKNAEWSAMYYNDNIKVQTTNTGVDITGDLVASGDVTAYSDARLKRNVETISNAVDLVNCLRGVNFEKDGRHSTGVIAQEVEEFLPEVVHTDSEGMKSVAYGNIAGLLIEAIKEQQQTIENLQKQISDIQSSKE